MPRIFPNYTAIALPKEQNVLDDPPVYGDSPVFDFETGDFKKDPSGKLLMKSGQEALVEWIRKTLSTPRFTHGIYPSWYGSDLVRGGEDRILGRATSQTEDAHSKSVVGDIQRAITEALLVDRRIVEVVDYSSEFVDDHVTTTFTVHSTIGPVLGLQAVTVLRS